MWIRRSSGRHSRCKALKTAERELGFFANLAGAPHTPAPLPHQTLELDLRNLSPLQIAICALPISDLLISN
jgi:hypothetical protein